MKSPTEYSRKLLYKQSYDNKLENLDKLEKFIEKHDLPQN